MKDVVEFLPIITLLFISLGMYYLNELYRKFNIKIAAYVSLSEIPSLLIDFYYSIVGAVLSISLIIWILIIDVLSFRPAWFKSHSGLDYVSNNLSIEFIWPIILAVALFVLTSKKVSIDFKKIIENGPEFDIILVSEDSSINNLNEPNENKMPILIGQTKEYIFLYNRDVKETIIMKTENIKIIKSRAHQKPENSEK